MNRRIILFGAFLSTFILILVPSISCVNANIQNENNLNIKNINIDYIKTIRNKLLDSDCNCQKPIAQNSDSGLIIDSLCILLGVMMIAALSPLLLFELFGSADLELLYSFILLLQPLLTGAAYAPLILAMFLHCEWTYMLP